MYELYFKWDRRDILEEVSDITEIDYLVEGDKVPVDSLISALEDILHEYYRLEEKYEDLKENSEPRRFNPYKEYGISEKDFH